jgi:hypothetical protein
LFDSRQKQGNKYLTFPFKIISKWIPEFIRPPHYWKIRSGNWHLDSNRALILTHKPIKQTDENMALTGHSFWRDYQFDLRFKFITDSSKPPDGGVIIYYFLNDLKNFYSFHLCLVKKQIEFVKRHKGSWYSGINKPFIFALNKDYCVRIIARHGFHKCQINDTILLINNELEMSKGCIGIGVKYCDAIFYNPSLLFLKN